MAKKIKIPAQIFYIALPDEMRKEDKLHWLATHPLKDIPFEHVQPDKNNNWINLADNDFESLLPLCDKKVKAGKSKKAVFELFTNGIVTNRDEWVYDDAIKCLEAKMSYFTDKYNFYVEEEKYGDDIKWSRDLKNEAARKKKSNFKSDIIIDVLYRPFIKKKYYPEFIFSDMLTNNHYEIFGKDLKKENPIIGFLSIISTHPLACFASIIPIDLCLLKQGNGGTQLIPLYRYDAAGNRHDNITDWGLNQFTKHYRTKKIQKEDVFHYVYAVLHHPAYRSKYELNLKREFPRVPLYEDFWQWAAWGKQLMDLHINYETVEPYQLAMERKQLAGATPKAKLKADKENGKIVLDEETTLSGIPAIAWQYKLGNRSALEWILDQYKESKPKDPTIAEHFNTYRFADYKEQVINLIQRVTTVSVETMQVVGEMP